MPKITRSTTLLLLAAMLSAAGCATAPVMSEMPSSDLDICSFQNGGGHPLFEPRLTGMIRFTVARSYEHAKSMNCDVAVRVRHPDGRAVEATAEVIAPRSGKKIGTAAAGGYFLELMAGSLRNQVLAMVGPSTEGGRLVRKERDEAPETAAPARTDSVARMPAVDPLIPNYSSQPRPDDFAIVIGVEKYSEIAPAPYAESDAALVKSHLLALGVPERNIVHLAGDKAGKTSIEKYVDNWLPRLVKPQSRVYFYFSGHGAPDVKTGQAYLVPWDGDPNFLETTGYPVARLYKRLQALPAKQILVAMDACFSGAGGRSVLATGARPLVTKIDAGMAGGQVTALTASAVNEISGTVESARHGAFTYFLAQGLNTAVDGAGRVTARSLHGYLKPLVLDEARRLNRDQTPQLLGDADFVVR
jgi:hypothetical protein